MGRVSKRLAAFGALSVAVLLTMAACGGADPTDTPRPTNTPMPTAMAMEATATPTAMAPADGGATAEPARPTATPTARPTATPRPVDPSFDAEAYFRGKTIRLMVGFNPGGGTDAQARYMSRAWPNFIPGEPRIIVTNLTPVVVERNFVWNSEPDGLTLAVEATPGVFDQVTPQAQFDMREATMIGVTSGREGLWVRRDDLTQGYDCMDSAFGASGPLLSIGTSAPTPADLGADVILGYLADEFNLPLEIKNLSAAGSAEQYRLIEQGLVSTWISGTLWDQFPRTRPGWIADGFLRPFADLSMPGFDLGDNGEADFHCPNVADEYLEGDQVDLYRAIRGPQIYAAKNIVGPPGIPAGVTAALRDSLADAMADEEFAANMQGFTGIKNNFSHGDQAQQDLIDTTNAFLDNKDRIDDITASVFEKYVR